MMDENVILGRGDAQSFKKNKSLAKTTNDGEEKVTRKTKKARLAEKRKLRGKAARRAESDDEMDDEDNEENVKKTINVQDERFGALFENHEFALDPTDPRYKDVESKALIASEREKRRAKKLAKLEKIRKEMLKNGDNVTFVVVTESSYHNHDGTERRTRDQARKEGLQAAKILGVQNYQKYFLI